MKKIKKFKYIYKNKRVVKSLDIEKSVYTRREVEDLIIFTKFTIHNALLKLPYPYRNIGHGMDSQYIMLY